MIVLLMIATALVVLWLILLCMASREDWIEAAKGKIVTNLIMIQTLHKKDRENARRLSQYHGLVLTIMKLFINSDSKATIAKLTEQNQKLSAGDLRGLSSFIMPGYVIQRRFESIGKGHVFKNILTHNLELHGKKYAEAATKRLLAAISSCPIIGFGISFGVGGTLLGMGQTNIGFGILGLGSVLVLVITYAMYDDVADKSKKRHEVIARQFPNVVSKLALLVTSGMNTSAAWQQTAESQEGELYIEMRKTSGELNNLVSPEIAYGNFINRCNTKETSKLAAAIMQNLSKGNAEIGRLLRDLAKESWQERKHLAKRDSEKANSKLMIPTMLLFIAILVMIVVPIFISMNTGF